MDTWTQSEIMPLIRQIEKLAPQYGAHVALTGGLLYKEGPRKDADLLFYRIRQAPAIDVDGLFAALAKIGIVKGDDFGFVKKATFWDRPLDLLFPEQCSGEVDRAGYAQ